jgi:hypothetical protein
MKDKQYRTHNTPTLTQTEQHYLPGEAWSFDGADATTYSKDGYRYAINFVDSHSKLRLVYFVKTNHSFEFKQALEYVIEYTKMHTGNDVKSLHCDMFSTYMESVGEDSIAAFRRQYGIILNVCPPYAHHRNHEAEHMIHNCTQHCRTRLRALLNAQVKGQRIPNPNLYWPFAWQHSVQCFNELPNVTGP